MKGSKTVRLIFRKEGLSYAAGLDGLERSTTGSITAFCSRRKMKKSSRVYVCTNPQKWENMQNTCVFYQLRGSFVRCTPIRIHPLSRLRTTPQSRSILLEPIEEKSAEVVILRSSTAIVAHSCFSTYCKERSARRYIEEENYSTLSNRGVSIHKEYE